MNDKLNVNYVLKNNSAKIILFEYNKYNVLTYIIYIYIIIITEHELKFARGPIGEQISSVFCLVQLTIYVITYLRKNVYVLLIYQLLEIKKFLT